MLSYTKRRNRFGKLTGDESASNLTLGDELMNDADRRILASKVYNFGLVTISFTTTANQSSLTLPHSVRKVNNIFLLIGSTRYDMTQIHSREKWIELTLTPNDSATYPDYFYVQGSRIEFYPIISDASNTITVEYVKRQKDLSVADYSTGTISAIANGDTTVTGSGTSWTSQMAGRYIRITDGDASGSGDGEWYEIASVTSTTELELVTAYQGTTISGGSASYVIGQVSDLPEEYQEISLWDALYTYWSTGQNPQLERADRAKNARDTLLIQMRQDYSLDTGDIGIGGYDEPLLNSNNYPQSVG